MPAFIPPCCCARMLSASPCLAPAPFQASASSRELSPALVSLSPVPSSVSSLMQLIAISASGVRVALRVCPNTADGRRAPPAELRPLFAVAPPRATDGRPLHVARGAALSASDCLFVASSMEDAQSAVELLCVSDLLAGRSDDGGTRSDAAALTRLRLHGSLYTIAEEPIPGPPRISNGLAAQFASPPRTFVLLTSEGVMRVVKRRPLDPLLAAASPQQSAAMPMGMPSPAAEFFSFYGAEEAACMCLLGALTTGADSPTAERLAGWAHAFGGMASEHLVNGVPEMSATAQGAVILGQAPRFSGRHGGICRALARLLQEVWLEPLCALRHTATGERLALARPRAFWSSLHMRIVAMLAHLDAHERHWGIPPGAATPPGANPAQRTTHSSSRRGEFGANRAIALPEDTSHARLRASIGGLVFSDHRAADARWNAMAGAPDKESESLCAVLSLARRVAQLALLLASLAEFEANQHPDSGIGIAHSVQASVENAAIDGIPALAERVIASVPPKLQTLLREGLTLQALTVPVRLDARGKPTSAWDTEVEARLPKALFMGLGQIEASGGVQVRSLARA